VIDFPNITSRKYFSEFKKLYSLVEGAEEKLKNIGSSKIDNIELVEIESKLNMLLEHKVCAWLNSEPGFVVALEEFTHKEIYVVCENELQKKCILTTFIANIVRAFDRYVADLCNPELIPVLNKSTRRKFIKHTKALLDLMKDGVGLSDVNAHNSLVKRLFLLNMEMRRWVPTLVPAIRNKKLPFRMLVIQLGSTNYSLYGEYYPKIIENIASLAVDDFDSRQIFKILKKIRPYFNFPESKLSAYKD